eukprot:5982147-Amphidinium_carterae.2
MALRWSSGTALARRCQMTAQGWNTGLVSSRVARSPSTSSSSDDETLVCALSPKIQNGAADT